MTNIFCNRFWILSDIMTNSNSHIMSLVLKFWIRHKYLNDVRKLYLKSCGRNRSNSRNNSLVSVNFSLEKKTYFTVMERNVWHSRKYFIYFSFINKTFISLVKTKHFFIENGKHFWYSGIHFIYYCLAIKAFQKNKEYAIYTREYTIY